MRVIRWTPEDVAVYAEGFDGGCIKRHFKLSALHGEREYIRHGTRQSRRGGGMFGVDSSFVSWCIRPPIPPGIRGPKGVCWSDDATIRFAFPMPLDLRACTVFAFGFCGVGECR